MLARGLSTLAHVLTGAVIALIAATAWLLGPLRMGRLLRTVSIPRLREHGGRTVLTVLGLGLGIAVVVAVVLVNRSVLHAAESTFEEVAGEADLQITGTAAGFDETYLEQLRAHPLVDSVSPIVQQTTIISDPTAKGERMLLLGIDLAGGDTDAFGAFAATDAQAVRQHPLRFLNSASNVIVSRSLAKRLGRGMHDGIELVTPNGVERFEIWGFLEDEGLGRAFGGNVAIMHYQAAQAAFNRGTMLDRIDLALRAGQEVDVVAQVLADKLGDAGLRVDRPARKTGRSLKMLQGLQLGLTAASLIAVLVGSFLIYNTMLISVAQRKREFGVLRALGTTRSQLLRLLALEATLLGLVGSAVGIGIGILLARTMVRGVSDTLSQLYLQVTANQLEVEPPLLLLCLGLGVASTVVSGLYPAIQATRIAPAQTLRASGLLSPKAGSRATRIALDVAGLAMLAAPFALVRLPPIGGVPMGPFTACASLFGAGALLMPRLIGGVHALLRRVAGPRFGVAAHLANENLPRDLTRSSITAGALMTGLAMAMGFSVFIASFIESASSWVEQSIPGDLFVTSAAPFGGVHNLPMSPELAAALREVDGVDLVEQLRVAELEYQDAPIKLISSEIDIYSPHSTMSMLEGDQAEAARAIKAGTGVTISGNLARRFGLHLGDRISLRAQNGERSFEVVGVRVDYTSEQGTVLMDRATYLAGWGEDRVDIIKVYTKPGVDLGALRQRIDRQFGQRYDLFILTNREFRDDVATLLERIFALLRALEGVAIAIAALGIINALLASVLDRIRELGVLRAVGMLRSQLRTMVVTEAALIGLSGVLGGLCIGLPLGYVLIEHVNVALTAWHFPFQPEWTSMGLMVVAGVVVAAAAGLYPADQAARLPMTDALAYE